MEWRQSRKAETQVLKVRQGIDPPAFFFLGDPLDCGTWSFSVGMQRLSDTSGTVLDVIESFSSESGMGVRYADTSNVLISHKEPGCLG